MKKELSQRLNCDFAGPILFHYVWWILREAQRQNFHTLYFLARDGYLLHKMALCFCDMFQLNIKCRYFYCSRTSLRMPSYHLIGDEAYQLLLQGGYRITLQSLLLRAEFNDAERFDVYRDCGLLDWDECKLLGRAEFDKVRQKLKSSSVYQFYVLQKSKSAYPYTMRYFEQEELFAQDNLVLVDSGWTGSMQRSFRQLLQSNNFRGNITGFYFGMYAKPKSPEDGTYRTWYFNYHSRADVKIPFCNNLFECLLPAPHGMTTGYTLQNSKYVPQMLFSPSEKEIVSVHNYINAVLHDTQRRLCEIQFNDFPDVEYRRDTKRRINRFMAHPRREEASYYGSLFFCDDVSESYHFRLAEAKQIKILKGYSIPARVWRRLVPRNIQAVPELFWPYGTIAFLPRWKQWWYRWNVYVWEWIRYALQ